MGLHGPRLAPPLSRLAWVLTAGAIIATTSVWLVTARDAALAGAREDVARIASQGATYVDNVVELTDQVLVRLARGTSEAERGNQALGGSCASPPCADHERSAKALRIAFARANGDVMLPGSDAPQGSLADRDYFSALKAADVGLFVGTPRREPKVEGTYLPLGRRLRSEGEGFHGIVAANVNVEMVRIFFQGLGTGTVDRIALRDARGELLIGWPVDWQVGGAGRECGPSDPATGDIVDTRRLRAGGLSVEVCRFADGALQAWRGQALLGAGAALLLLLAPALAFPTLHRRRDRRMRQQRGLRGLVVEAFDVQFIIAAKPGGTFVLEALTFNRNLGWGGAPARLVGRTTGELFPAGDAEQIEAEYRSVLASGETRRSERRINLGGMQFVWSTVLVPLRDVDGGGGYIYGGATDLAGDGSPEVGLRRFTERVLRREDNERRRIARELHDTTGQNLIAAGFELGVVERGLVEPTAKVRAALMQARTLIDASVAEVRTLSYVLHPALLDEAGLCVALATLAEGFEKRAGIRVSVEIEDALTVRRWSPEVELALYRVAQEALTNVQRHSSAKEARVVLDACVPGHLRLVIAEGAGDGPGGISVPPAVEGAGIRGMRDRLEALGGSLAVARRPTDFRITAMVPDGAGPI
ncbi:histidine kinase [Methylobacterium sp. J-070]|uniref:histidine kinase n=1 Tax=Methylobacterium sp. J-070 TaxID=2836650 RepID=UPI001FBB83A4|nr:histidine kinase [Methylobacterium sp. J-070]MCJ2053908.1 histidine kinase [Methylobacterium sp. J-070]